MTKKQIKNKQIKYGAIQKVCHLHNGIFEPIQLFVTLCQFYSIRNYRMRNKELEKLQKETIE